MSETPTDERTTAGTERTADTLDTDAMKWLSGLAALIGLWILASPFVYESTRAGEWNNIAVGAAILLLAGYNFYRMSNDLLASVGVSSLVALLGLWAFVAPFVIDMGSDGPMWSTVVSGLIVAAVSGYNAYANRKADARAGTRAGTRA